MDNKLIAELSALAKIGFTDKEMETVKSAIAEFEKQISVLDGVKAPDVNLFDNTISIDDLRDDKVEKWNGINECIKNAPKTRGQYFVVPQVRD